MPNFGLRRATRIKRRPGVLILSVLLPTAYSLMMMLVCARSVTSAHCCCCCCCCCRCRCC